MARNLVLLIADSLRYDSVWRGGDAPLPWLRAHARAYHQVRSAGCWTLPATATLFTGLHPHEHGATSQTRGIREVPTLAERLRARGYATHQVTANVATTDIFGLHRGFDSVDRVWKLVQARHAKIHQLLVLAGKPRLRERVFSADFIMGKMSEDLDMATTWLQDTQGAVFDRARALLTENSQRNTPSFLFLNLMETHFPYHVEDLFTFVSRGWLDRGRELHGLFHLANQTWLTTGREHIGPEVLAVLADRQRRAFRRVAPEIDAFCAELRSRWDAEVVFCADHGENFGEQGWIYHFSNVNDAGNRIPVFHLAGDADTPGDDHHPASSRQIHDTLLRAAGDPDPTLRPLSAAADPDQLPILQSYWYNNKGQTLPQYRYNQFAFVAQGRRWLDRRGAWFEAPMTEGDAPEAAWRPVADRTDPLREPLATPDQMAWLRGQHAAFTAFSDAILAR